MSNDSKMVTLANGSQVPWDEFSNWSVYKQRNNLVNPGSFKSLNNIEYYQKIGAAQRKSIADGKKKLGNNAGCRNGQAKAVITPRGEFPSIKAAAAAFGVDKSTLGHWIRITKSGQFYFANINSSNSHICSGRPKKVKSPDGIFDSIQAAADHYQVGRQCITSWIKSKAMGDFSYILSDDSTTRSARPVQTPVGKFNSKRAAGLHYGVQAATIQKWIDRKLDGFSLIK